MVSYIFIYKKMYKKNFQPSPLVMNAIILCIIAGFTLFVYWGIQNHQFLNFDDDMYVISNYHVRNGINLADIKWAFSFNGASYWHPLTWLSLMLDCQLFGLKAGSLLSENVALHILNALLLFLIILRMTGARFKAALVALLFALHPLNVESVAWLVERKTVLSTLFLFGAIYTYLYYADQKKKWQYALIMFLYACGLMSKPAILTFPVLLIILDYWPLKRFKAIDSSCVIGEDNRKKPMNKFLSVCKSGSAILIYEKLPFAILSVISVLISMYSLFSNQMIIHNSTIPVYLRIYNLFISIFQYLYCILWPVDLSIFYPFPRIFVILYFLAALLAVVLITIMTFITREKRPWLIAGWLWFLIALLPASGLIQAGLWPAIANRFMYLPLIGFFIIVVWEADERLKGRYSDLLKGIICVAAICYFAFLARVQNLYFSNSYSLFHRSLEIVEDNALALNNIGAALSSLGKYDEAMKYFARGIKLYPTKAGYYQNYGVCLSEKGDYKNAITYFKKAISLDSKLYVSYMNLGLIQSHSGNKTEALKLLKRAFDIDQDNLDIRNNLGIILVKQGKYKEAIDHFLFVVQRDSGNVSARLNLAQAYQNEGLYNEAMSEYEALNRSVSENKGYIYYGMASVYSQQKKYEECAAYLEISLKEGFNVLEILKSDNRFKNFRKTPAYVEFLENYKIKKIP